VWSCQGTPINIRQGVVGKITRKKKWPPLRRQYVYLCDALPTSHRCYSGILSTEKGGDDWKKIVTPCVCDLKKEHLDRLEEGDIVLLEPDGTVNLIWSIKSKYNAILATEDCNCSCIMCPQPKQNSGDNLIGFNLRLLKLIDSTRVGQVGITGGEPTLIGRDLIKLIAACKKRLPKASLSLLTNARKFSDADFVKELTMVGHPNLTIGVPLYADTDTEHDRIMGRKGCFYETLEGIRNLALFGHKIEIRNVIHLLTYKRLLQFSEFIYHNFPFVMHIAFMGMEATGLALKNLKRLWIDPMEYMPQLESAVKYLHRRNMNVSVYNLQLCILPRSLWPFSRRSISDWKNIYIEECSRCDLKEQCCGFFKTSGMMYSQYVHRITEDPCDQKGNGRVQYLDIE